MFFAAFFQCDLMCPANGVRPKHQVFYGTQTERKHTQVKKQTETQQKPGIGKYSNESELAAVQPPLPERGMSAAWKERKVTNMTFSFMFARSLQFGGLEQRRHLPKPSPASAARARGAWGRSWPKGVAPTCLLPRSVIRGGFCCVWF